MDYVVIIHAADEGGFWAEVPVLPGCYTQGETLKETEENAREAIASHLQALLADGAKLPEEDTVVVARVTVASPSAA